MSISLSKVVKFDISKHLPTSSAEKTNDLFFALVALHMADMEDKVLTKLTLQKALYSTTQLLSEKGYNFFNTHFYVNTLGPFSNLFYKYLEELQNANLIEIDKRDIFLTPKGNRVTSEIIDELSENREFQEVFKVLNSKVTAYADNPNLSITETHSQLIIDTTDSNKQKSINDLIIEIDPTAPFEKNYQFKYIELVNENKSEEIKVPPKILNELDSILAKVEDTDYEEAGDIRFLFN